MCEVAMNLQTIEQQIKIKGLKKGWVAEKIGIHPVTLRRFLKGDTELKLEKLAKLLEVLDLKFEALMKKAS